MAGEEFTYREMQHTKGVWLRQNVGRGEIEYWHDGEFIASWGDLDLTEIQCNVAQAMLETSFNRGKALAFKGLRELIGVK